MRDKSKINQTLTQKNKGIKCNYIMKRKTKKVKGKKII